MSIESLLLILVITFWLAFVLNRLQPGQRSRRTGKHAAGPDGAIQSLVLPAGAGGMSLCSVRAEPERVE